MGNLFPSQFLAGELFHVSPLPKKAEILGGNGEREMEVAFCSSGAHFARSTAPEGKIMHNHCMQHFAL